MTTPPIRVLIAEDHLIARVGVGTIVETQADMQVVAEAANGAEAVHLHGQHRPDVTLMDIRMPVMGGVEAMRAIRARAPLARFTLLRFTLVPFGFTLLPCRHLRYSSNRSLRCPSVRSRSAGL